MNHDNSAKGARVFLADDHPAVLDGLTLLLGQDNHVICGVATSLKEAKATIDESHADVAMVDLSLCGESGLDLIPLMVERNIPVLVYSMHEDAATQQRATAQGARGYVTKRESSDILLEAVRRVHAGECYVSPRAAANLAADAPVQGEPLSGNSVNTKTFSERERQIWTLLAQGESNVGIAAALEISVRTVESYYTRMMAKLDLDGIKALRKLAISESRLIF